MNEAQALTTNEAHGNIQQVEAQSAVPAPWEIEWHVLQVTWSMAKPETAFALGGTGTALIAASGGNFGSLIAIIGVALLGVGAVGLCRMM